MTSAVEGQIEFEHYHRYCLARDLCFGRDVLDVASGEGYGAALLAGVAHSVIGVEINPRAVQHARSSYQNTNLRFLEGDALALPMPDASVDVVVSFETLEHVADHARFVAEVSRVLRPDGLFIVSTPDRTVYSAAGTDPNPYHVLELTEPELRSLLQAHFSHVRVLAQRTVLGSLLVAPEAENWRSYERRSADVIEATNGLARAVYLVAVATDGSLPDIRSSVYLDRRPVDALLRHSLRLPVVDAKVIELTQERDIARAEAARIAEELRATERARATAEERAEDARRAVDAVTHSVGWRLLAPVHAIAKRQHLWASAKVARAIRESGSFDPQYYLDNNPDVAVSGIDPALHYVLYGAREGREPNPLFDTSYYLAANPDVAAANINPLFHFVTRGAGEGRRSHPNTARYHVASNSDVAGGPVAAD